MQFHGSGYILGLYDFEHNKLTNRILHITQQLSLGGAGRAILYLAKYSSCLGPYSHEVLSVIPPDPAAKKVALELGIPVYEGTLELESRIESADIVQFSWWNNVEINGIIKKALPSARTIGWFHCGGVSPPHIISSKLANYFDIAAACSPYTLRSPALKKRASEKPESVSMILGATDFARLEHQDLIPHEGFNVGYIGTLDFVKMHPEYVSMSAACGIDEARFIVCGSGPATSQLIKQAKESGSENKFEFRGQVENVGEVLATLDVYGYPLCQDTYAASELNLQEAMFMGLPAVVFPHGGIQDLVRHNETALVVNSTTEYTDALRFLYNNPKERKRLGDNAKTYAREHFGAQHSAIAANSCYESLLKKPKRTHVWPTELEVAAILKLSSEEITLINSDPPACLFIDSLGEEAIPFVKSIISRDYLESLKSDISISNAGLNLAQGGIGYYRVMYPNSRYLNYWTALTALGSGDGVIAQDLLVASLHLGLDNWRVITALYFAAKASENSNLADKSLKLLKENHFSSLPSGISDGIAKSNSWRDLSLCN